MVTHFLDGFFQSQSATSSGPAQIYSDGPTNNLDGSAVGANPAWRSTLWEILYTGRPWLAGTSVGKQNAITSGVHSAMDELRAITPGGGCYVTEADALEEDWQEAFFGSNYLRLLSIKNRYDPTNFFNCYKCVGWNGPSE
jgi:hypothetical protein